MGDSVSNENVIKAGEISALVEVNRKLTEGLFTGKIRTSAETR